jgi:hypothetical protein
MGTTKYVTLFGSHGAGDIWQCGFHCAYDGDPLAGAQAVADSFASKVIGAVNSAFPTAVTFRGATMADLDEATGKLSPKVQAAAQASGPLNGSLPPECAICVTLVTIQGVRGRFYLPPLAANTLDVNGFLAPTVHVNLSANVNNWFHDMADGTAGIRLYVYSRKLRTVQAASTYSIGSVVDTQRRRRNKVAESRLGNNMPV